MTVSSPAAPVAHPRPTRSTPTPLTDGPFVREFIETFCRHSKGEWAGQALRLRPWQRELVDDLFRLRPDGSRQHRTAYIGLPRKSGKSTLVAALGVYGLVADGEPGGEIYSCAGDREQARIVFGEAKKMVEADPDLSRAVRVYRNVLEVKASGSIVLFDEVHVQPNEDLWTALTLGSGTRRQPLIVGITTAGYDEDTLAFRLYEYGKRVRSGEVHDPTFFFYWREPSNPDCDYRDPAVWTECNPALGDFLKLERLEEDARLTPEHDFRRFHLNQWTVTADAWLPYGAWDACEDRSLELSPERPTWVGIDMAYSHDAAAVVAAQRVDDRTVVRAKVWENPYPPTHSEHVHWKINPFEVESYCRDLYATYPVPSVEIDGETRAGPAFHYDPAWFSRSAPVLTGEGLAMVELPQSDARMIPVAQTTYQLVVEGKLAHDGDPVLKRHVENGVVDRRPRGWRISKSSSKRKIDGLIACAIGAWAAQTPAPAPPAPSVYERRGFVSV